MRRHHFRGGNESFRDCQLLDLLSSITTLFKVDLLNVFSRQVVLSVGEGLDFFKHDVVHVQPDVSGKPR